MTAAIQLLSCCKRMSFDIKTKLKFLDPLVSPILLCAAGVWGIYEYEHIDNITLSFASTYLA